MVVLTSPTVCPRDALADHPRASSDHRHPASSAPTATETEASCGQSALDRDPVAASSFDPPRLARGVIPATVASVRTKGKLS